MKTTPSPQAAAPAHEPLHKQIDALRKLVREQQREIHVLKRQNAALYSRGVPSQNTAAPKPSPLARASQAHRVASSDALTARLARHAEQRATQHAGQRGLKGPAPAAALNVARPSPKPAAAAAARMGSQQPREPSLFVGGSIEIGIIPEILRGQYVNSWATTLMSVSQQALELIWNADAQHAAYQYFVLQLAHIPHVPLHWFERQASRLPLASDTRRAIVPAAAAHELARRAPEQHASFITRAEPFALVSGACALALLSLSRGDVDNFARTLSVMPRYLIAELFTQIRSAHVFDNRSIWSVLVHLQGGVDICDELFVNYKELIAQVVADFLNQHLNVFEPAQTQSFLQRLWPSPAAQASGGIPLKTRYLQVLDALLAHSESQASVHNTLEHFEQKRVSMQQHGLVFALVLDGLDAQVHSLCCHLQHSSAAALPQLDATPEELRYQVHKRWSGVLQRAKEGVFVPGEPRLSKDQMAQLPERLRGARRLLGQNFISQVRQWRR